MRGSGVRTVRTHDAMPSCSVLSNQTLALPRRASCILASGPWSLEARSAWSAWVHMDAEKTQYLFESADACTALSNAGRAVRFTSAMSLVVE